MLKTKHTVVVVDDDASMNLAMKRVLNASGFHAETFASAEELLEAGVPRNAECLVLDICLPGLSGFELMERLSARRTCVPVIFVTAHEKSANREQAEKAGAIAYLLKPFNGKGLIEAVYRAFDSA